MEHDFAISHFLTYLSWMKRLSIFGLFQYHLDFLSLELDHRGIKTLLRSSCLSTIRVFFKRNVRLVLRNPGPFGRMSFSHSFLFFLHKPEQTPEKISRVHEVFIPVSSDHSPSARFMDSMEQVIRMETVR
jgi:hypothetical protein